MSRELIERLASSGMNMREAAESVGMKFYQFRNLRDLHKDVKWQTSNGRKKGLAARWKAHGLSEGSSQ